MQSPSNRKVYILERLDYRVHIVIFSSCKEDLPLTEFTKRRNRTSYHHNYTEKNRRDVIAALGSKCKCGFSDWRALQIDHISGGGKEDRRKYGGANTKRYLNHVKDHPEEYQLLCANCNWIKKYENNETFLVYHPARDTLIYSIQREIRRIEREELLDEMGGKCRKCGHSDWRSLQIDHINGGGTKEFKNVFKYNRIKYHRHVLDNPEKYQLLCANCNWIKRHEQNENRKIMGSLDRQLKYVDKLH